VRAGARTLLVEDLDHRRALENQLCKALREAGAVVDHVFVNFYYDIFPESKKVMSELGVRLHHLATWWDVLRVVKQGNYLPTAQIAAVEKFLGAPAEWSAAHGGVSSFPFRLKVITLKSTASAPPKGRACTLVRGAEGGCHLPAGGEAQAADLEGGAFQIKGYERHLHSARRRAMRALPCTRAARLKNVVHGIRVRNSTPRAGSSRRNFGSSR